MKRNINFRKIPIIINNYNRYTMLKSLIDFLQDRGYFNILIIDNNSTYPELLAYYKQTNLSVIKLRHNIGCYSLWRTSIWNQFSSDYYVYSDPDVLPTDNCPENFVEIFFNHLAGFPSIGKAGFGLKINDIPDCFGLKNDVLMHESNFWKKPLGNGLYFAPIDTTFALYRPGCGGGHWVPSLRTDSPLLARHLPWYLDSANLDYENRYYINSCKGNTHWTNLMTTTQL